MGKKNKNLEEVKVAPEKKAKAPVGLAVAKGILYALTFPVLIVVSFIICFKLGSGASYYTFWPYVPAILMAIFGLIFLIVALVINRKKSKKTAMQKTVGLLVCCILLTGGFGVLMDVVFPDIIGIKATSSTLFVEDVYNEYDVQAARVINLQNQFIRLNILNGNYDGKLAYENLSAEMDVADSDVATKYAGYMCDGLGYDDYQIATNIASKVDKLEPLKRELYDFIYKDYVLFDYNYSLKIATVQDEDGADVVIANERKAFCLALTDKVFPTYQQLCKEGVKTSGLGAIATKGNDKMSWIFNYNYAGMNKDGYDGFNEDAGLGFATANRMTIPVVLRLILSDNYDATQPLYSGASQVGYTLDIVTADGNNDKIDGFMTYLYKPEISAAIKAAHSDIAYDADGEHKGRSEQMYEYDGNLFYVYENDAEDNDTGYVEGKLTWCVLDMLGDPMDVAALDLGGLLGDLSAIVMPIIDSNASKIGELLDTNLVTVINEAAGGQQLYLKLFLDDEGMLQIVLVPAAVENGFLGYQFMTWMQSGNLLTTVCGVMSLRNLLYIFGAVSIVMIVAIGVINDSIEKKKNA